jgi:hypothetical protein
MPSRGSKSLAENNTATRSVRPMVKGELQLCFLEKEPTTKKRTARGKRKKKMRGSEKDLSLLPWRYNHSRLGHTHLNPNIKLLSVLHVPG